MWACEHPAVANRHFGKFADVWKHLPLVEVLLHETPGRYAETHAGSAVYDMVDDPERRFGVRHFIEAAPSEGELARSRYLELISPFLERPNPAYPGSATLAMSALGGNVAYLFCEVDRTSAADLQHWTRRLGADRAQVALADGMATTERWLDQDSVSRAVVHVDPFQPHAKGELGRSALELAAHAVDQGHMLVYWYGYDHPEQAAWAYHELAELTARQLWCGNMMITDHYGAGEGGDLGVATTPGTGCGVVLGNVATETTAACERLGVAVAHAYRDSTLPSGQPGGVRFTVVAP
jgi:23S rRNA A2030 N6-methylase RlmJ